MSLESLFIKSKEIEFKGVKISIKDVCMKDLPLIVPIVASLLDAKGDTKTKVVSLVSEKYDSVVKIIANLTDNSVEDVERLSLDAVIFIISEVIKDNVIFLKKNVMPLAEKLAKETK